MLSKSEDEITSFEESVFTESSSQGKCTAEKLNQFREFAQTFLYSGSCEAGFESSTDGSDTPPVTPDEGFSAKFTPKVTLGEAASGASKSAALLVFGCFTSKQVVRAFRKVVVPTITRSVC